MHAAHLLQPRCSIALCQADMLDVHTLDRPDVTPNSTDAWTRFEQDKYGPPAFNGGCSSLLRVSLSKTLSGLD